MRLGILSLLLLVNACCAATYTAASLSWSDVSNAVYSASSGDTVVLPPGAAAWSGTVLINRKPITIQGAGTGVTIITNTQSDLGVGDGTLFEIVASTNGLTRITAAEFNGNKTANLLHVTGDYWGLFRIDHCKFVESAGRSISASGMFCGLVDHCTFVDCDSSCDSYAGSFANTSWQTAMTLGTTNAVIMEDCFFYYKDSYTGSTASTSMRGLGARSVIRYCKWTNSLNIGFSPIIDVHGNQAVVTGQTYTEPPGGTASSRSSRHFEMYGNFFHCDSFPTKTFRLTDLRGGTCLIFSNTWSGSDFSTNFYAREEDGDTAGTGLTPFGDPALTSYPGYDQHRIYSWSNFVNGVVVSALNNPYGSDTNFFFVNTNVFWQAPAAGTGFVTNYSPLTYPHPLVVSSQQGNAQASRANVGRLIRH